MSKGWYKVEKYDNSIIDIGNYNGDAYIHGTTNGLLTNSSWRRGFTFCIDPNNSFRILNADKVNCKKRAEFTKLSVSRGINKYTFNP